jgi:hypothetical protein
MNKTKAQRKIKVKKKRGPKPLGGLRIILRILPYQVELLDKVQKRTGITRTQLIQRAIDTVYGIWAIAKGAR